MGNKVLKYKVVEGYDHFNGYPLYHVVGIDNEFCGEWHTSFCDAHSEMKSLNAPQLVDCIFVSHVPSNTLLKLNLSHMEEGVIFIENHFDCECSNDFIHPNSDEFCHSCGAVGSESPDSRLNEWFEIKGYGPIGPGREGFDAFISNEDVRLQSHSEFRCFSLVE